MIKKVIKIKNSFEGNFTLSSGLNVQIYPTIQKFKKTDWGKLIPKESFFLSWDYLLAFEKLEASNFRFQYAIVLEKNRPLAAFYFQLIFLSESEISYVLKPLTSVSPKNCIVNELQDWFVKCCLEKDFRLLVSGNNFISGEYGIGISPNAVVKEVFDAFADTVKLISKNDKRDGKISAILVKDYFENTAVTTADHLQKKRYHRFLVEPEMIVAIQPEWKKFNDYLQAFSKKYRNRANVVLKKTKSFNEIALNVVELEKVAPEIYQLYKNVYDRAKFRLSILPANYFIEMKKAFPDTFHIYIYQMDGKVVAFRSEFLLSAQLEGHFIGLDYAVNELYPIYQRMLYDFIRDGIALGYQKVYLGRTAAVMKSTVGAVAHDLVCYLKYRNGIAGQIARPFIEYLKPSIGVIRNPFK